MNDHPAVEQRLGLVRWLTGHRHGIEGYLYICHRISGIVLLLFLSLHVLVTSSRLFGEETWQTLMSLTHSPALKFLEYLVFVAFAFHATNGVRLILIELGFAVGKAEHPVYPYRGSLHKQRPLMIVLMVVAAVLIVLGGFDALRLGR
ncbi:MAG: succinate dehydrogenase, cytochrome b556 subunit [Gammaproteobacteria bacterium]|nr:succinate dehydrogenase, cytochrome b556 subunit [Gammaproteobacteria bacterium]